MIYAGPSLLSELSNMQVKGEMCDTRLVADNGSLMVHWAVLEVRDVWWCGSRVEYQNTVILPGVSITELAEFVNHLYSQYQQDSWEVPGTKKLQVNIERLPQIYLDKLETNEVKYEAPDSPELLEEDSDNAFENFDVKSEASDQDFDPVEDENYDNKATLLASNFIQLLENGDYDQIVYEQYKQKRNSFPKYIDINKRVIKEAVMNIRIEYLTENPQERPGDSKWLKYILNCGLCDYKHKRKRCMIQHMTVHFKRMFNCTKCGKAISHVNSHIKNIHPEESDQDFVDENDDQEDADWFDFENKSTLLASNFIQLLEDGKFDTIVDVQYQQKRSSFPEFIAINKEVIKEAVMNIKLKLLSESSSEKTGDSKWVKYILSCGLCDYKNKVKKCMMQHMTVHFKRMYHCTKCDKAISHVNSHIKNIHSGKAEQLYICDICNKQVKSASQLAKHKGSHTLVYCDQCDFVCEGREKLTRHRYHRHRAPSTCPICHKVFNSKDYLRTHLAIHGNDVFNCDQCGKTYKSLTFLRSHINVAHRAKEIHCEFCGQTFSNNSDYKRHKIINHIKVKSYQCPECDYKGYTKQYLQYHMEIHKEAKLACNFCGKTFRQNGALKAHIMTHTGERPYGCTDCTYRCIQPFELRKHFLKQHNKVIERPGLYLSSNKN